MERTTDVHGEEAVSFYRVRLPDKGAGATRCHYYVQGKSEEAVREQVADHPQLNLWDSTKGTVSETDLDRDGLEDRLTLVSSPNEAYLTDGTRVLRDRENGGVREVEYNV